MQLTTLDWTVISVYGVVAISIGVWFARRAGSKSDEFFWAGARCRGGSLERPWLQRLSQQILQTW